MIQAGEKAQEVERLTMQLGISDQEREEASAALGALRKEIESLRATSYEALSEKDTALMQVKELQERTEQLDRSLRESPTAQQISELQQMLNEERKRADMLQEILDEELAKGTKASLARQLADALRDVEEAREELRQLRRQSEKTGQSGTVEARVDNMESPSPSLAAVLADLPAEKRRNLADALAATNILGEDQLSEAVQVQKQHPGTSLASVLLDKNMVQPEVLAEIVSLLTRVPVVSLDTLEIDKNAVAMVPTKLARMRRCIPIRVDDQEIEVAMESPMDLVAVEDIERATGRRVVPKIALRSEIEKALDAFHAGME